MKLTLLFDSYCPLCTAEMKLLGNLDIERKLIFVDIHAVDFSNRFPAVDPVLANKILHGIYEDGSIIFGLDVTHQAWRAVGQKPWLAILRWPIIRWFTDFAYVIFAKNRYAISWLITGKKRCVPCATKTVPKRVL